MLNQVVGLLLVGRARPGRHHLSDLWGPFLLCYVEFLARTKLLGLFLPCSLYDWMADLIGHSFSLLEEFRFM